MPIPKAPPRQDNTARLRNAENAITNLVVSHARSTAGKLISGRLGVGLIRECLDDLDQQLLTRRHQLVVHLAGVAGRHMAVERLHKHILSERMRWVEMVRNDYADAMDDSEAPPGIHERDCDRALDRALHTAPDLRAKLAALAARRRPAKRKVALRATARFQPSTDYRSILWRGTPYTLTPNQATIVRRLHEAHLAGTPALGKEALLDAIQAETSRVRDSFKGSTLLDTLVVRGDRRGTYKLNI